MNEAKKRYEIVVVEQVIETVIKGNEWKPTRTDACEYGHTPEIQVHEVVTRKLYTQDVDKLDLAAVIRAVNGMDE
jgi:hypothetical protein